MKNFVKNVDIKVLSLYLVSAVVIVCQGCMSTTFLYGEENQPPREFGTLHSVPDRPEMPDVKAYDNLRRELQDEYQHEASDSSHRNVPHNR